MRLSTFSTLRRDRSGVSVENREYLCEFKAKYENTLSGLSGPQVELFYEIIGDEKSRDTVPIIKISALHILIYKKPKFGKILWYIHM
jgi:hypothetical protein